MIINSLIIGKSMKFILYFFMLLILFSCGTVTEKPRPIPIIDKKDLAYPDLEDKNFYPPKDSCYILQDKKTGEIIDSKNANKKYIPGSTLKILTAIFALSVLGENHEFKTRVFYDGNIDKKALRGNIYIKGEGDPLFFTNHMMILIEALKKKGIEKVIGGFYYDHSNLYSKGYIDANQNSSLAYNPGIGPLAVEFNRSRFFWERDGEGKLRYFSLPVPYFNKMIESNHDIEYENDFVYKNSNTWDFSKDNRNQGGTELPVKNPAGHFSLLFHHLAKIRGVMLPFPRFKKLPSSAVLLYELKSPRVSDIVGLMMEYSNNLLAESLLLQAAKVFKKPLSLRMSAHVMEEWLIKEVKVKPDHIRIVNGSGLSVENRISCQAMNDILGYASKKRANKRPFLSYFPVSGIRGSLYSRLIHPYLALKVWAKTGSMNYASALAGYLFNNGQEMTFTIIMNDLSKRKIVDQAPSKRSRENLEAGAWRRDAQEQQDLLIQNWILNSP